MYHTKLLSEINILHSFLYVVYKSNGTVLWFIKKPDLFYYLCLLLLFLLNYLILVIDKLNSETVEILFICIDQGLANYGLLLDFVNNVLLE